MNVLLDSAAHGFRLLRCRTASLPRIVCFQASSACCCADFKMYAIRCFALGAGVNAEVKPENARRTVLVTMICSALTSEWSV